MKKILTQEMTTRISLLAFCLFSGTANAESPFCVPAQTCSDMGYSTAVSDCDTSQPILKCPFDTAFAHCTKKSTPEKPITCTVGSVLYDDKKCYSDTPAGKTPIAVVFDTNKRLAIALENSSGQLAFGGYGTDIPNLTNCTDSTAAKTTCEPDGKANTKAIIALGSSSYPAAKYCNEYTTSGTKAGDWFLPSLAELNMLYSVKNTINTSLQLLGKSEIPSDYVYWSSTEYSSISTWDLLMGDIYIHHFYNKSYTNYVRPVIQYGESSSPETDCSSIAVTVPANASCTGSSTDCPGTCTEWSCNSGYTKSGNSCVKDCTYSLAICPSTAAECDSCVNTSGATKYKVLSCKPGYKLNGQLCMISNTSQ